MAASDKPDLDDVPETPEGHPDEEAEVEVDQAETGEAEEGQAEPEPEPLTLDVQVEQKSACERHITVSVAPEDIQLHSYV